MAGPRKGGNTKGVPNSGALSIPIFPSPPPFHWPFPKAKRQDVTGIKTKPLLTRRFQWYICYPTVIPKPSIWWAIFQRFVPFDTRSSRRRPSINQSPISSLNGHRKQEYYELQGRDEWTFFVTNIPKKLREKLAHESLLSWLYNYLTNIASKNTVRIRHRLHSSRPVCLSINGQFSVIVASDKFSGAAWPISG